MGIADRNYDERRGDGRGGAWSGSWGWSATMWIMAINIAVFVVQAFSGNITKVIMGDSGPLQRVDLVTYYGHFSTLRVTWKGGLEFWRFVTFQFVHGGVVHIFFNMIGLYMFGGMVEEQLGAKKYVAFYLVCGICGAVMYMLLNAAGVLADKMGWPMVPGLLFHDTGVPLVGASAGVFGVLMAVAYLYPREPVSIILPAFTASARTVAYVYVAISLINLLTRSNNAGGEAAHIGGAIAGYFFVRNSHLLRDFFDIFEDSRGPRHPVGRKAIQKAAKGAKPERPKPTFLERLRGDGAPSEAELARVYDKIREQGMQSLSDADKALLERERQAKLKRTDDA